MPRSKHQSRPETAAPFAHVAIETASGPHVTPVLFAADSGRIWFVVARDTLKARVLAKRPRVGLALHEDGRGVLMRGDVRLLDPLRPATWARAPQEFATAPFGLGAYALRNPRELFGFALDTFELGGTPLGSGLLLAAFDPSGVATVGDALESSSGRWPEPANRKRRPVAPRPVPDGLPRGVASLPRRDGDAILGWMTADGPVALPARWDAASSAAVVPNDLGRLAGVRGTSAACVSFDVAERRRPTGKRGVMLRGQASARSEGRSTVVTLATERATWWRGFETGTVAPPPV